MHRDAGAVSELASAEAFREIALGENEKRVHSGRRSNQSNLAKSSR